MGQEAKQEMLTVGNVDKQKVWAKPCLRTPSRNHRKPLASLARSQVEPRWAELRAAGRGCAHPHRAGEDFVLNREEGVVFLCSAAARFQAKPKVKPSVCSRHVCGSGGFCRNRKQRNASSLEGPCRGSVWEPGRSAPSCNEARFPVISPHLSFRLSYGRGSHYPSVTGLSPPCSARNMHLSPAAKGAFVLAPRGRALKC